MSFKTAKYLFSARRAHFFSATEKILNLVSVFRDAKKWAQNRNSNDILPSIEDIARWMWKVIPVEWFDTCKNVGYVDSCLNIRFDAAFMPSGWEYSLKLLWRWHHNYIKRQMSPEYREKSYFKAKNGSSIEETHVVCHWQSTRFSQFLWIVQNSKILRVAPYFALLSKEFSEIPYYCSSWKLKKSLLSQDISLVSRIHL